MGRTKRIFLACAFVATNLIAQQGDRPPSVTDPRPSRFGWLTNPYKARHVNSVDPENTSRVYDLLRAGNIYLSLEDAIALAIENNLGVEAARYQAKIADTDILRSKGGGTLRGVTLETFELPEGVGGPSSPLINSAATGAPPSTSVPSDIFSLTFLQGTTSSLSTDPSLTSSPLPSAAGPAIPQYDPTIAGSLLWMKQTTPEATATTTGSNVLTVRGIAPSVTYTQGFSPGTQISAAYMSNSQNSTSLNNNYNPATSGSLGITVTQPLLRGFGIAMNRRWIRIAKNDQKISDLVFRQDLINLVYGVSRLYYDLASLADDHRVKVETLNSALELLKNTEAGVAEGTLAQVELTRARAQTAGAELDVINSEGVLEEQEALLKTVITRKGSREPAVQTARLIVTDTLSVPTRDETPALPSLVREAEKYRPDLAAVDLEVVNSQIAIEGTKSQLKPELNLVGVVQNSGLAGTPVDTTTGMPANTALAGGYGTMLDQVLSHRYPTYEAGIQLNLPLRNRVAIADLTRDEIALRTFRTGRIQLQNQIALEIDTATIALRRARSAYDAAVRTRRLQEESLDVEKARFEAGVDTAFLVIQYQAYLSQARSSEVAAKGDYFKAVAGLDRAVGDLLERHNISMDESYNGHLSKAPAALPQ